MGYENFMFNSKDRYLSECYYITKSSVTFRSPEDDKIIEFINHWSWEPILTACEPYTDILTRIFYANLVSKKDPFYLTTWICGQEIHLSLENITAWFDLPNEGEETYLLRDWTQLTIDTADNYKKWFDRNNIGGAPVYVSHLPSMHRLLFLFINNILVPKATIKTNLKWGPMYYLRHLIQKDNKLFNIPYIILRHMQRVFESKVTHLPYAKLIHKIIWANYIEIPLDQHFFFPINLVTQLTKIGWVLVTASSGLMRYAPNQRDINRWINRQDALPNQYWDPKE